MPDSSSLGIWPNLVIFACAAVVVWFAGTKLTAYAKTIAERTGAGQAFVGILLVGAVVSLPEMATSTTAAVLGNTPLAVNTLLGGVAIVMVIMAVIDAVSGPEPLSVDISHPVVLLQGVLVALFMTIAAAGMVVGDIDLGGVGAWTTALFVTYLVFVRINRGFESRKPWTARNPVPEPDATAIPEPTERRSTAHISVLVAIASAAILIAGVFLATSGEALGDLTGLGSSFIGMLLGGIATSLPEISTTLAAVRLRQFEMAFADAFGTNLFSTMLLFVNDIASPGGPILNEGGRFALFAVLLGIMLTTIYLAGFVARSRRGVLRMGFDSAIVILVYAGAMALLYRMR